MKNRVWNKLLKCLLLAAIVIGIFPSSAREVHAEGGVSVSTDAMSMSINDEKTFRIKAENCVANIDITSSDKNIAMVSHDSLWLDNETALVTVSAHQSGNCTITINVKDATTYDEEHFTQTFTINVQVKKDLLPQEVIAPVASIASGNVSEGTRLFLSCETPDAVIYYSLNEASFVEYDDAIVLSALIADSNKEISIKAYAVKESYTDSVYNEYHYVIVPSEEDYGDISDEDQEAYEDPSQIPQGFWVTGVKDFEYTGKALTQENIRVYYHTTLLKEKTDYVISYKNNTNAGTAIMTVSGKGNYSGSLSKEFHISGLSVHPEVTLTNLYPYNKSGTSLSLKVVYNKKTLKNKTDYTVTILTPQGVAVEKPVNPGDYNVRISGMGNYEFYRQLVITIAEPNQKFVSKLNVSLPGSSQFDYDYTGSPKTPVPTIKDGTKVLDLNEHFDIRYENNTDAGTATMIVSAKADDELYIGSMSKTFKINGIPLSKIKLSGFVSELEYTGREVKQNNIALENLSPGYDYEISYENNIAVGTATMLIKGKGLYSGEIKKTFKISGISISKATISGINDKGYSGREIEQDTLSVKVNGVQLYRGSDYEVTYKNNIKAGTASMSIYGIGKYTGSINKSFKIIQTDLNSSLVTARMNSSFEYEKGGVKPEPIVKTGTTVLVKDVDYKLTYKNNSKINDNSNPKSMTQVIITGKGNYKGSITKYFTITAKDLSDTTILVNDFPEGLNRTSVTIIDTNGKNLSVLKDYRIEKVVYNENVRLKNGTQRYKGEAVFFSDLIPANTVLKATIKAKGSYTGSVTALYKACVRSISSASATIQPKEYTGEPILLSKSEIVLKDKYGIISSSQYDIISYRDNVQKGNATVVIKGKGAYYGGIKEIRFKIANKNLSCTIHFDGNGATSGSTGDQSISMSTNLKSNDFKKSGSTFAGWSLTRNGPVAYANKALFHYDESCYGKTITLYAVWR